nr:uncharacterized protein LOC112750318 isoform X1 [Arachis hypogaea]
MEPPPLSREPEGVETEKSVHERGVATIVEDSITAAEGPDRRARRRRRTSHHCCQRARRERKGSRGERNTMREEEVASVAAKPSLAGLGSPSLLSCVPPLVFGSLLCFSCNSPLYCHQT